MTLFVAGRACLIMIASCIITVRALPSDVPSDQLSALDARDLDTGSNATSDVWPPLALPDIDVPHDDFFSMSDRVNALRNVFETILQLERALVWNPIVPSRMSRGFFLVKLLSNVLRIMPFREVTRRLCLCIQSALCTTLAFRSTLPV